MKAIYFPGQKYGDYTLIKRKGKCSWHVRCECGKKLFSNPAVISRTPAKCTHAEALAGKSFGDYDIASPAVIVTKQIAGSNTRHVSGKCRRCGHVREMRPGDWARYEQTCDRCIVHQRHELDNDTHISLVKARAVRGISKQRIYQIIDDGLLDAEEVGKFVAIVKNEKWKAWKSGAKNKRERYASKYADMFSAGDKIGCWTVMERLGSKWGLQCECGRKTTRGGNLHAITTSCCHSERFKIGAMFGNLKVVSVAIPTVRVQCKCRHEFKVASSNLGKENFRKWMTCRKCKSPYQD